MPVELLLAAELKFHSYSLTSAPARLSRREAQPGARDPARPNVEPEREFLRRHGVLVIPDQDCLGRPQVEATLRKLIQKPGRAGRVDETDQ